MAPKKDSAHHYGYGWYNEKQLEDYYNKIIGNFFNIVSIAKLTISLCLLHISLRWPRQDPREEDLHRCQEDHLPGGCQVRRHPCLDWWDPHDDLQLRNLHSPNPQSTRPSRRTATLIRPAPWSTTTSSSPSCSASTPRASWWARSCQLQWNGTHTFTATSPPLFGHNLKQNDVFKVSLLHRLPYIHSTLTSLLK